MKNNDIISKTIVYVNTHIENHELSLQRIADAAGFSWDYYNRMFFSHTGFTVMAYVNYVRLKKALVLLRTTDKTILEIALEVGYLSQEGFSKAFAKNYGMTPSEYRKEKGNRLIKAAELADRTNSTRFIHENVDFVLVDAKEVIEYLLDTDSLKYGRLCGEIKQLGLVIAAQGGDYKKGFIGVHTLPMNDCVLEMVTEDMELLAQWLKRFEGNISFHCNREESDVLEYLRQQNIHVKAKCHLQSVYQGSELKYHLPDNVQIRKLEASDLPLIKKWACGKNDAYVRELMKPEHYRYDEVLEYGVFEKEELIAVAGCGVDEVQGFVMNDCCIIRFAAGKEEKDLYYPIYAAVTERLWKNGIVPYDVVQFGDYAEAHGDFTALELGYRIVDRKYDVLLPL